jgi:hypothetical protein
MGDYDMRSAEEIERSVKHISFRASRAMNEDLWANIARAGDGRTGELAPDRRDLRRFIMKMSTKRIAIAALVCLGVGAVSAVGVNLGKIYYRGKSADGTHHIFYDEGSQGASDDGFITMDANGVTDVEQTRRDLAEMKDLSRQGKKELLRVKETIVGAYRLKTHVYRYQLSDGRTEDMGEPAADTPMYSQEQWREFSPQLKEFFRLRDAGPGEDLGTYEETVEGRVFSFKRAKYVLGDGTEVIWSVGTPKDGQ